MQAKLDNLKKKFDAVTRLFISPLIKSNTNPNLITAISFLFGVAAVYFLFENHFLFVMCILAHLGLDRADGTLARALNRASESGELYDYIADTVVGILLLAKSYFYLSAHYVALLALGLYVIHHGLFILNRNRRMLVGSRTVLALIFLFGQFAVGVLASALLSATGIIRQIILWKK